MVENILKINQYPFPDKYLQNYLVDLKNDQVILTIMFSEKVEFCTIKANHIIGASSIGIWDEWIIESVHIQKGGDLVLASLETIQRNYGDSDSVFMEKHVDDIFYQLIIKLIDGTEIKVAAKSFEIEELNKEITP